MKKLMLGLMMAFAANVAFADPFVTINKVEAASPWISAKGTITVGCTLGGPMRGTFTTQSPGLILLFK